MVSRPLPVPTLGPLGRIVHARLNKTSESPSTSSITNRSDPNFESHPSLVAKALSARSFLAPSAPYR